MRFHYWRWRWYSCLQGEVSLRNKTMETITKAIIMNIYTTKIQYHSPIQRPIGQTKKTILKTLITIPKKLTCIRTRNNYTNTKTTITANNRSTSQRQPSCLAKDTDDKCWKQSIGSLMNLTPHRRHNTRTRKPCVKHRKILKLSNWSISLIKMWAVGVTNVPVMSMNKHKHNIPVSGSSLPYSLWLDAKMTTLQKKKSTKNASPHYERRRQYNIEMAHPWSIHSYSPQKVISATFTEVDIHKISVMKVKE